MRRLIFMVGLLTGFVSTAHCSSDYYIDSVTLTDDQGETHALTKTAENEFTVNQRTYKITFGPIGQGRAKILFTCLSDKQAPETLESPFKACPSTLSLNSKYDPKKSITDYINELNDKKHNHICDYEWNRDGAVTLSNGFTPFVRFCQSYELRFWKRDSDPSQIDHQTSVSLEYGTVSGDILGKYLIHTFPHSVEKKTLENIFFLKRGNRGGELRKVEAAVYSDKPWFKENGIKSIDPYAVPAEVDSKGLTVLEAPDNASGKYYQLEAGFEWRPSRYIYVSNNRQFFLTKVKRLTLSQVEHKDCGLKGVQFTKVKGLSPIMIDTLDMFEAPIISVTNVTFNHPFNRGFYELTQRLRGSKGIQIETYVDIQTDGKHRLTHNQSSAWHRFEGTDLLLNADDQQLSELIDCVRHFKPYGNDQAFKIAIDLRDKSEKEKFSAQQKLKVAYRLMELLNEVPGLEVDAKGLDVTLTKVKDLPGDEAYWTFLDFVARIPAIKISLVGEVRIQDWNSFANDQRCNKALFRTQPSHLGVKLKEDSNLACLHQFIEGNEHLTHLYLNGCVEHLGIPFFRMLSDHKVLKHLEVEGFIDQGHLGRLKGDKLWDDQKDALAAKWYGLKDLDFQGDQYPFQFFRTGIELLQSNAETITTLNLNGLKGFKQYGADLVTAVDKMKNLVRIALTGDVLGNIDTVDMTRALSTKKLLKEVDIDMPYWVSNALWLPAQAGREFASSRSFTEGCGNAFVLLCSIPMGSLLILADIDGHPTPHYFQACRNLAVIPQLSLLKLVLWGAFPYGEWTINSIKEHRKQAGLPDTCIEIVK